MRKLNLAHLGFAMTAMAFGVFLATNNASALDVTTDYVVGTDPLESDGLVVKSGSEVKITLNKDLIVSKAVDAIYVESEAKVTIEGNGKVESKKSGFASLFNNGETIIRGGHFIKDDTNAAWYAIVNHGVMTIEGGKIEQINYKHSSLVENGYYDFGSGDERTGYVPGKGMLFPILTVKGGKFVNGRANIKNDDNGKTIIEGGDFEAKDQANLMNWNKMIIKGGNFKNNNAKMPIVLALAGTDGRTKGELVVEGGKFTAKAFVSGLPAWPITKPIEIKGGEFNNEIFAAGDLKNAGTDKLKVLGGKFKDKNVKPALDGMVLAEDGKGGFVMVNKLADGDTAEVVELFVGETHTIMLAKDVLENITPKNKDAEVAKVMKGIVTGLKVGKTEIVYAIGENKHTVNVTVKERAEEKDETPNTGIVAKKGQDMTMAALLMASTLLSLAFVAKIAKR